MLFVGWVAIFAKVDEAEEDDTGSLLLPEK